MTSRRNFIKISSLASTAFLMPSFLKGLNVNPEAANGKKLVIIQLSGGNDGLNMIVPYQNDIYYRSRPQIHIAANEVLKLNDEQGFNPDVIRLAVYKLNHCNCWDIAFQQRADVWHATGNFASNSFKDLLGDDADGGWRDDIEIFKNGYDSPVEWIRDLVDKVENI